MIPKFSIVVPVYNVSSYLPRCVNSLINQTYPNIEIILVNDGSTDESPVICNQFVEKDSRVKVIHKNNGGLSDARNWGIKNASGEYIIFVDSDDYIELNSCEKFLNYANDNVDIILGNAKEIKNHKETSICFKKIESNNYLSGKEMIKYQLENKSMHMEVWFNVYRREFLLKNNLYFKYGILHEDAEWTPRVFLTAKKVVVTDIIFYNYVISYPSITRNKVLTKNAIDLINTSYELSNLYEKLEDKRLKDLLNDYLVILYLYAIYIGKMYKKEYKSYINKKFIKGKALFTKNKIKVYLFTLSPALYYYINAIYKKLYRK